MPTPSQELKPIIESTEDYEAVERKIIELYRREIYLPLMRDLKIPRSKVLKNSIEDLVSAIQTGRITFSMGIFRGRFSAAISKELKRLGARWDRKQGTWKISQSFLPIEVRSAISASEVRFQEKIAEIDARLSALSPEIFADKLKVAGSFDTLLWKTDRSFEASIRGITISPKLSPETRRRVSQEWEKNMQLWIQDFTEKEVQKLRKDVQTAAFSGNRYESMIATIKKSYGVTQSKAKFLARQETSLLMAKYKQTRYEDAGVRKYKWTCVHMPKQKKGAPYVPGEVRYSHGILDGKVFRWDQPPVVNEKGERKNPGQDYNCRCYAIPIVEFATRDG